MTVKSTDKAKRNIPLLTLPLRTFLEACDFVVVNDNPNYVVSTFEDRPDLVGLRHTSDNRTMFNQDQLVTYNGKTAQVKNIHGITFNFEFRKSVAMSRDEIKFFDDTQKAAVAGSHEAIDAAKHYDPLAVFKSA